MTGTLKDVGSGLITHQKFKKILLKKSNAGANATGRKFNFPENINKEPVTTIKKIMKYFLYLFDS